jgi:hypothetical protein
VDLIGIEPMTSSMPSLKKKCPVALVSDPSFTGRGREEVPGQASNPNRAQDGLASVMTA